MKKPSSPLDIPELNFVQDEMLWEAERIENNPEAMLRFIDWLFIGREDEGKQHPS